MMKKKQDINDYCTAGSAAQILTEKLGRPIRPDYISKMSRGKKRAIRVVREGDRILYHRDDIAGCDVKQRQVLPLQG